MQFNTHLSLNSYFHLAFNYNFIISFHVTIYIIFMVLAELLLGKKWSQLHFVLFSVTGFPVWVSIVSIGIVCTFYTTIVSNCFCFCFIARSS